MIATFFYDLRIIKQQNKYYSPAGLNDSAFSRYNKIFDGLIGVGRGRQAYDNEYLNPRYKLNFNFAYLCETNIIKKWQLIKKAVAESEYCIIRLPSCIGLIACYECSRQKKKYSVEIVGNAYEAIIYGKSRWYWLYALMIHHLLKVAALKSPFVAYVTESYLQKIYPTKGYSGIALSDA